MNSRYDCSRNTATTFWEARMLIVEIGNSVYIHNYKYMYMSWKLMPHAKKNGVGKWKKKIPEKKKQV